MIEQKDEILSDENISLGIHKVLKFLLYHMIFVLFYFDRSFEIKVNQPKEQESKELWNCTAEN